MTKRRQSVNISEIVFFPVKPDNKGLQGFVSFTFNDQLRISDVAIFTRLTGESYRFSYPIKTLKNGKTIQSIYPINKEVETVISEKLIEAYKDFLAKVK